MKSHNSSNLKLACFCVVKNAETFIEEWIAYQINLGFDTIIVFDNLSTDKTRENVIKFMKYYDVRYFSWKINGPLYQRLAHKLAVIKFRSEFDWIAFLDVDEFIVLPKEINSLRDFLNLPKDVSGVALPWCFFGSNGLEKKTDELVIKAFTRRSIESFPQNRIIKSIVRPRDVYKILGPHGFGVTGSYVNMNKEKIPKTFLKLDSDPNFKLGKLHHYFVKSKADWAEKLERGYGDITRNFDEFYDNDRNDVIDETALAYEIGTREIVKKVNSIENESSTNLTQPKSLPSRMDLLKIFMYFEVGGKLYSHIFKNLNFSHPSNKSA